MGSTILTMACAAPWTPNLTGRALGGSLLDQVPEKTLVFAQGVFELRFAFLPAAGRAGHPVLLWALGGRPPLQGIA